MLRAQKGDAEVGSSSAATPSASSSTRAWTRVTSRRTYRRETIQGTDAAAYKRAQRAVTRISAEIDKLRAPTSPVSFSHDIDEWLRSADIETSTRDGYMGYIERVIRPVLGETPVNELKTKDLETLYSVLRRCRTRCDDRPFIVHKTETSITVLRRDVNPTSASRWLRPRFDRFTPSSAAN
ncbi:hypothetical protein ALI144C_32675 [Actinosynnema sp. ALI-1.44]|uniref:hypothetical protein n=1 Tax=Actinosynnema sp. ALI-1.44 TaxID=1933779 RepID=UPI00097CBBA6|nr:hypothetical protein [Actinosynnema sp. ALI-1.44]ONI76892.1 hypothetical protein ALI144C_32675 [Actinosynnema sp. ALI-1.44]